MDTIDEAISDLNSITFNTESQSFQIRLELSRLKAIKALVEKLEDISEVLKTIYDEGIQVTEK